MRIKINITGVEDCGDFIRVTGQGSAAGDAEWRPFLRQVISVPATKRNKEAMRVGRNLTLTIAP